jgi:hypothetical protein
VFVDDRGVEVLHSAQAEVIEVSDLADLARAINGHLGESLSEPDR